MSYSPWTDFWKDQKQSFHSVMKVSTTFFAEKIDQLELVTRTSSLLDYGCGPGFLADYFSDKGVTIAGADINNSFIDESRKRHPEFLFVSVTTNNKENEGILKESFGSKKFDVITLLSIVQYFEDENELEKTICLLLPYLASSGKLIIADVINEKTSSIKDALSVFVLCLKKGKAISFVRFIFYILFSDYSDVSKKAKLLSVSEQSMKHIAATWFLKCKKIEGLTPHPTRSSYILERHH